MKNEPDFLFDNCRTCKWRNNDLLDPPCDQCDLIEVNTKWQPADPPINEVEAVQAAVEIHDGEVDARLSALEAEVKRLRERKACQWCHGTGVFSFPHYRSSTACVVTISDNKCHYCNGTGYMESEDKC